MSEGATVVGASQSVDDLRWSLRRLIVVALVGVLYLIMLARANAGEPDSGSALIFFRLFYLGEPIPIALLVVFAGCAWRMLPGTHSDRGPAGGSDVPTLVTGAIALVVAIAVGWFARSVLGNGAFSMDEFGAVFQARLFAAGRVAATVPPAWRAHLDAITPVFVTTRPVDSAWVSSYLPGNALIRAPFERADVGWFTGVLLAVVCVVAITGVSRRLWPRDGTRQIVAIGALALSSQFLVVAGTPYAMTAHLAVNLCWLYAWVRGGRVAYIAGPIGIVGVLLHQPVPHLLFAAPFGVRALRERRWPLVIWMGACYALALAFSSTWHNLVGFTAATGGLVSALAPPQLLSWFVAVMHALLLCTWQTPLAALAMIVCIRRVRVLTDIERDLMLGLLLSLVFYLFFKLVTQGHGWGWRYGHQVLGNAALLTGSAWPVIESAFGAVRARRVALLSAVLTVLVQLPLRAREASRFARPFANASRWIRAQDADVIVVPNDSIWYGRDLVRNDPALTPPIVVFGSVVDGPLHASLQLPTTARVRRITVTELTAFGLERVPASTTSR